MRVGKGRCFRMQSKTLVWAYLLILSLGTILSLYIPKNEAMAKESVVIPGDAIRLRILANSDTPSDQQLKRDVRDAVNAKITLWVKDLTSLEKAKTVIHEKLPEIQGIADKVVKDHGSTQDVHVKFGKVQFPTKLYGEFLYPAGEYQAILITLGKGEGANWWCVLYPPLCFLDFSNGVAVSSEGFDDKQKVKSELDIQPKTESAKVDSTDKKSTEAATVKPTEEQKQETTVAPQNQAATETPQKQETTETPEAPQNQETTETPETPQNQAATEAPQNQVATEAPQNQEAPVYTSEDEQPVKVKFFIVELWEKLFD